MGFLRQDDVVENMDDTVASFDVSSDELGPDILVGHGISRSCTRVSGTLDEDLFGGGTGVTADGSDVLSRKGLDEANITATGADFRGDDVISEEGSRDDVRQQDGGECGNVIEEGFDGAFRQVTEGLVGRCEDRQWSFTGEGTIQSCGDDGCTKSGEVIQPTCNLGDGLAFLLSDDGRRGGKAV